MGNNFGAAGDATMQADIFRTALELIHSVETGGVLIDYPTTWNTPFVFAPGGSAQAKSA